jgi:hypothetical protein
LTIIYYTLQKIFLFFLDVDIRHTRDSNIESSYFPRAEALNQSLDDERVARAGQRVHGHAPASESHTLLVELPLLGVTRRSWITAEHRLAHEVSKIQGVAYVRHPAEQIRQAYLAIEMPKRNK